MGRIFDDANPSIEKTGAYLDYIETCTEGIRDAVSTRQYTTALTLLAGVRETIDILVVAVGLELGIEESNQ